MTERHYSGIPASPGIVMGKVYLFESGDEKVEPRSIKRDQIPQEIAKLENALIQTRREILDLQKRIAQGMDREHAEIFNAHLLVVEDRSLIEEVIKKLESDQKCVEYAFQQVTKKYVKVFSKMDDEYLRERASDVHDIARRVIRNLLGKKKESLADLKEEVVVIAYDLSPSDTALMHKKHVIGFATDIGGRTSHTVIMARSLEIPAVVGLGGHVSRKINADSTVIVDGNDGLLIVDPTQSTINKYKKQITKNKLLDKKLSHLRKLPAETKDKHRVILAANIELQEDIPSVVQHGAEGIGLYRTEFLYLSRSDVPSEQEQYETYEYAVRKVSPYPVIIRTMDLGGDKFLSNLSISREINPYLGWRAIRFSLARLDVFTAQLRAILRASASGKVRIMYPMISGLGELKQANEVLEKVKRELSKEKIKYDKNIEVGAMIEVPSAALCAEDLAKEVKFFSIGTNDLIQYALAIDRVNEKVAYLYEPTHPAIIKLLKQVIDAGHKAGIWVGLCGEMAGDPVTALLAVGLGIDELSTSSVIVPNIKRAIRSVSFSELQEIVKEILEYSDGKAIYRRVKRLLSKAAPDILLGGDY